MIESVIFDIDGTLWDTREIVARGMNRCLVELGHPELQVTAEFLKSMFGKTMTHIADTMLAKFPAPRRYEIMDQCTDSEMKMLWEDPCQVGYPGVRQELEKLSRKYRLFIVSNSQQGYPELLIDKLDIGGFFEGHLCFGDTGTSKGKTIRTLMERHHISSCVYVGDTQGDLDACREAGVPFVFCRYGFGTPDSFDAEISDISQLSQVLETF